MHVSYAELVRVGPEAIRMTGFTFGQADDALEGIVWTECVLGHGYDLLRMADRERAPSGWPKHSVEVNSGIATVELRRCPAYGVAARLADLAKEIAGDPSAERLGRVETFDAFGGWIAPYIAYRLARGNQHAAVFWRPGPAQQSAEAPAMLIVAVAAGLDEEVPPLLIAPGRIDAGAEGTDSVKRTIPLRLLRSLREASTRKPESSMMAIAATPNFTSDEAVDLSSAIDVLNHPGLSGNTVCLDATEKFRRALEIGIEVAPEDHRFLNALSQRIRLPNTERSKSQAG